MKINFLRKKYPKFTYEKYSYKISGNNLEIFFNFKIKSGIYFRPKIIIENIDKPKIKKVGKSTLNNLIFHLGLMEIPSYWKATCSPEIVIKAGNLSSEQIKWWKDLIMRGMGQFFYENKIDFRKSNFLKITTSDAWLTNPTIVEIINRAVQSNKILAPIGGGKDSAVTLEILKKAEFAWVHSHTPSRRRGLRFSHACFSLNPTEAAQRIMRIGKCKNPIIVKRKIDKKLLKLNQKGFLNGHTPFSAYLAFLSILIAVIFDQKYIAVSNERSSNEGNLKYLGKTINHQYSKSFDFEKKFRKYSKKYLAKNTDYFSFLRPLYEIQIAKLFSKYQKYFSAFLSCNEAYKTASGTKKPFKKWCGNCSKCLFVFATLYPFVKKQKLIKIFKKNLFESKNLLPIMQELIGEKAFKPFECVGTKKETLIAFYLSYKKCRGQSSAKLPLLLEYFKKKILPKYQNLEKESKKIMNSWDNQHNLPKEFEKVLKKVVF